MKHTSTPIATLLIVGCVTFSIVFPAIAHKKTEKKPAQKEVVSPSLTDEDSMRYNRMFLDAIIDEVADRYDSAYQKLNHCIALNPNAAEAYYFLATLDTTSRGDSLRIERLSQAVKLSPRNDIYQERLGEAYIDAGQYDKSIEVYEQLSKRHADRTDELQVLLQLYNQQKDYDKMLQTLNRIEQIEGTSENITLAKVRIFELQKDEGKAYQALQDLCQSHPNDPAYRIMTGNWLMQKKRLKEAFDCYQSVLKEDANNVMALESLYDYYAEQNDSVQKHVLMMRVLCHKDADAKTKQTLIRQLIQEQERAGGDSLSIIKTFDSILKTVPSDTTMLELKAAYMVLKKFPMPETNAALTQLLTFSPNNKASRIQLLQNLLEEKKWQQVLDIAQKGLDYDANEITFYYLKSIAYLQKDQFNEVIKTIQTGMKHLPKEANSNLVSDLYAILGDCLQKQHRIKESFEAYDSCLKWNANNIECLNNYAYFLSESGKNLDRAAQMSQQTIQAEPNNTTYLDTYAWILFRQKKFAEARLYIDQALKNGNDSTVSSVIFEHAGDIYIQLHQPQKAMEYWQQALQKGSERKAILTRKMKLKKYIQ